MKELAKVRGITPPDAPAETAMISAGFYADPLVYDVLHTEQTTRDARIFSRIIAEHTGTRTKRPMTLLEPASGTGRYLLALARGGHTAVGIDLDVGMVAFANARAEAMGLAQRASSIAADMCNFKVRSKFDGALNPINSIRHLLTDAQMLAHLECVGQALQPDGVYLVGVELIDPNPAHWQPSEDVWTGKRGGLSVSQLVNFLPPGSHAGMPRRERVVSTITVMQRARGGAAVTRQIDSQYQLRTYTPAQWSTLLRKCGWESVAEYAIEGDIWAGRKFGYRLCVIRPA